MSKFALKLLLAAAAAAASLAVPVKAQLLGGLQLPTAGLLPPVDRIPIVGQPAAQLLSTHATRQATTPSLDTVTGLPLSIAESGPASLMDLRRLRLRQLVSQNPHTLDFDDRGEPVRRGILIAIDPDPLSLQLADNAGFRPVGDASDAGLGIRAVQLAVPSGLSSKAALKRLQRAAPNLQLDYDHVFQPAGGSLAPVAGLMALSGGSIAGPRIGMIDGGAASSPALAGASIEQNGFTGAPKPTGHGTAVASLIVGREGAFHGAALGAQLYVADVYGGSEAAGSATVIAKAFAWLAANRVRVINISLVGPPNKLLERVIAAVRARGIEVVAAVGNDGPAAPPQYPASYPGVVSVTAVDGRGHALVEAGKPTHLDFAAPGADMAAALPGRGYARVRGTSFAAPLAAARLLIAGSPNRLAAEAQPGTGRIGRGVVCGACRIDPRLVGGK